MKMIRLTAAVLAALAGASVNAADVQVYGRIDTGLVYQHFSGDSDAKDTFSMESGPNTASRWGIQGSETLNDDVAVGYRLESRFASDTGVLKGDRMFEGNASVKITSKTYGEVALGRISGIGSGSGPYDLQFFMDAFGGGTLGTALAPVKSSRMDNVIVYRSPVMAGAQVTLQHSLKMDQVKGSGIEAEADADRFWAAGLRYHAGNLNVVMAYEGTTWGHANTAAPDNDKSVVYIGGGYRFEPVTVYVQAQYFDGVEKLDGFTSSGTNAMTGLKGYGLYLGTEFWYGLSSWKTTVYWRDYDTHVKTTGASVDGDSLGLATKFVYRPSKTIDMYVGAGVSRWDRLDAGKIKTDKTFNVFSGMTKYF